MPKIEGSTRVAHRLMLAGDAGELHRHVPTVEIDHPAAAALLNRIEWSALSHPVAPQSFVRQPAHPAAAQSDCGWRAFAFTGARKRCLEV
jgi:hypothetical protein